MSNTLFLEILSNDDFKKGRFGNGGGKCEIVSVWGVESRISVSMWGIKVGESPESSQAGKERTPSVWMRLHHDGMARVEVPGRWIT